MKGGGALIVSLTWSPPAQAYNDPEGGVAVAQPAVNGASTARYDPNEVDSFIAIHADNTATI